MLKKNESAPGERSISYSSTLPGSKIRACIGIIFSIIFAESGLLFGFFLPGDSLLITAGVLSYARPQSRLTRIVTHICRAFPELYSPRGSASLTARIRTPIGAP